LNLVLGGIVPAKRQCLKRLDQQARCLTAKIGKHGVDLTARRGETPRSDDNLAPEVCSAQDRIVFRRFTAKFRKPRDKSASQSRGTTRSQSSTNRPLSHDAGRTRPERSIAKALGGKAQDPIHRSLRVMRRAPGAFASRASVIGDPKTANAFGTDPRNDKSITRIRSHNLLLMPRARPGSRRFPKFSDQFSQIRRQFRDELQRFT
jgi:hypothetical protein